MCFTGIIINPKHKPIKLVDKLLKQVEYNPHGFYLYIPTLYLQTMSEELYKDCFKSVMKRKPSYVHFHFRLASSGALTLDNVHGWNVEGYYITHNGVIFNPQYTSDPYYSDTYLLINEEEFKQNLINKKWSELYDFLLESGFTGVMFIVKNDFSEMYGISVFQPIHYKKVKSVAYITSKKITLLSREYNNGVFEITYDGLKPLVQMEETKLPLYIRIMQIFRLA
jgi:hypothetical protein